MPQHGRERLADYRWRSRINQNELAKALKITKSYLSQVLSGKRRPSLPIAVRIERLTGIQVESWLVTERGRSGKTKRANVKTAPVSQVQTDAASS